MTPPAGLTRASTTLNRGQTRKGVGKPAKGSDVVSNDTTSYADDNLGRMIEETNELAETRYFGYNAAGLLVEKTGRDGRVTQYEYDDLGRLLAENWLDEYEQVVYTISDTYDALGRVLTATSPLPPGEGQGEGSAEYDYVYDDLGRVVRETQTIDPFRGTQYQLWQNRQVDFSPTTNPAGGVADWKSGGFLYENR